MSVFNKSSWFQWVKVVKSFVINLTHEASNFRIKKNIDLVYKVYLFLMTGKFFFQSIQPVKYIILIKINL